MLESVIKSSAMIYADFILQCMGTLSVCIHSRSIKRLMLQNKHKEKIILPKKKILRLTDSVINP